MAARRERSPSCSPGSAGGRAASPCSPISAAAARPSSPTRRSLGAIAGFPTSTRSRSPARAGRGARALPRIAGLPDDVFEHDGQLTKREVRAATLAALAPLPGETLWDVGAGCGSIAIEWLRAGEGRSAIAIERDPARAAMIARNAAALGVPELRIVLGRRTRGARRTCRRRTRSLSAAGSARPVCWRRRGRACRPAGASSPTSSPTEGEARLLDWHARHGGALTRIAVSRAEPVGPHHLWRPLATVTQLAAVKPG